MDKRFKPLDPAEQMVRRRQAITDVLAHPEWGLQEAVVHLKTALQLTTRDLARLSGVGYRTLQDIERGVRPGTVQTMDAVLGVFGLRLGVVSKKPAGGAGIGPQDDAAAG